MNQTSAEYTSTGLSTDVRWILVLSVMESLVLVLDISLSRRLTLAESIFVEASEETSSQSVSILHSVVVSYRRFDTIYRPIFNCQAVEEE